VYWTGLSWMGKEARAPPVRQRFFERGGGETRGSSNPAFGTIEILKGNPA